MYVNCTVSVSGAVSWRCMSESCCHAGASWMDDILASSAWTPTPTPARVEIRETSSSRNGEAIVVFLRRRRSTSQRAGQEAGWTVRLVMVVWWWWLSWVVGRWWEEGEDEDGRDVQERKGKCSRRERLFGQADVTSQGSQPVEAPCLGVLGGARPWFPST